LISICHKKTIKKRGHHHVFVKPGEYINNTQVVILLVGNTTALSGRLKTNVTVNFYGHRIRGEGRGDLEAALCPEREPERENVTPIGV
jgi:hypothetical protein